MTSATTVRDDPERHRFVAEVDGEVAGFAVYHVRGGRYLFVHTEIDPAHEGKGIGSQLARAALDEVRGRGARVVPICPFIGAWVDRHADYGGLVDQELLARLSAE